MGFWSSVAAVVGIVAAPFTGGLSLVLTAAAIVAPKIIDSALDFVMKPFMGSMGAVTADIGGAQEAERQQGILVQRQGSVVNIPVVYGFRKVGDIVTFAETGATDNKYLWVAHVLCEGQIAALRNIYIDDYQLTDDVVKSLNAGNVVNVGSGKYSGRVRLQLFKGVYWQDPTPANHPVRAGCFFNTDGDRPPSWTSDMVYNGLAVIFARYEWKKVTTQEEQDANPFGYSIPKITVEMFGKLLSPIPAIAPANEYDGDSARYEILTTSTGAQIGYTNPAEVLLDYLRNPRYGKGLKNSDIDWASWHIAAQKCKTEVTYVSGIKGPIMSMNFVLDTSLTLFSNTKTILSNFRGYMPYVQGKYKLKIEDAGNPTDITSGSAEVVAQFTPDNIVGEITYTGIERTSKYNQVAVTWVDPDNKWSNQEVVYPETEAERQTYINQDGGRENKGTFTASGITNPIMAKDLARVLFWKSRLSDTCSLTVSSQGLELEPGDCIHIKGNILDFNTTYPWRVISSTLNNDMTVTLGCVFIPDYIFPYTRWGEPDRVLPVYVPKGAERYYPVISPSEKNGLLPPYPGKPGSGGTILGENLNDMIIIDKISFVSMGTGPIDETSQNIYADVLYAQPNNTLYYSTKFFWKEDVASVTTWQESESVIQPGAGKQITTRIGPVVFGKNYVLNTRVTYASGQPSTQMGVYRFTVSTESVSPPPPPGTPTTPGTPGGNPADNYFASVSAITLLDGTYPNQHPKNPRQIQVTLKQFMGNGNNEFLNAVEVFYKPSANAKWNYLKNPIAGSQGSDIVFTLNLGVPVYPLRPGYNNEAPGAVDDYDFIFRFAYSDGQVSKYQWHATNASVEWNGITWGPFNPFAVTGLGLKITPKELSADYVPQIANANDIVDTRYIEISSPYSIRDNGYGDDAARFFFYPPVEADRINWRGVRVYRHKAGAAGTGDYVDFTPATVSSGIWSVFVTGIGYDETWEYVLTALVTYGEGIAESNRGQYIVGKLHPRGSEADYPSDGNWMRSFRADPLESLTAAKAKLGTAPASPPRLDTYIDSFNSSTVLDSGAPSSPRRLSFTFTQSIVSGLNGRINKYVIYYKQADNQYWKRSVFNLTGYVEGQPTTIDSNATVPPMDLGYPSYPNLPGRDQYYDFVIRYGYDNDMESTYEHAWLNTSIENRGTSTENVVSFSPLLPAVNNARRSSQTLTTEDKAPPGAVLDVRDILTSTSMYPIALEVMDPPTTGNVARFGFAIPIAQLKSYLAGFRILRREVISGYTTEFTTDDSNVPYKLGQAYINNAYVDIISAWSRNTSWHREYEWAVIPLVWYQGVKTEANNAVYWRGKVCDTYNTRPSNPWVSNWYSKRAAEVLPTNQIRNRLSAVFPSNGPVARMLSITRTNPNYTASGGDALGYWTIKYQVPDNFVSATIYRRFCRDFNSSVAGTSGLYQGAANFGDAGQWERIVINNANNPVVTEGTYKTQTVNLRPAIADYFNDKSLQYGYDLSKPRDTVRGDNNTFYFGYNVVPPGTGNNTYTKYWLAGDNKNGANQAGKITQLLIVITTNVNGVNTTSINALRVDLYNQRYINNTWVRNADGDPYIDAGDLPFAEVEASLDKSAIVGVEVDPSWGSLLRKPSEAIDLVPDDKIVKPGQTVWTVTYTKPTATPGVL